MLIWGVEEGVSGLNILLSNVLAAYCGAKKQKKTKQTNNKKTIFHRERAKVLRLPDQTLRKPSI